MGLQITIHKRLIDRISTKVQGIRVSDSRKQKQISSETSSEKSISGVDVVDSSIKTTTTISTTTTNHNSVKYFPSEQECKIHLRILRVFANIKEDVSSHNGLFGIKDDEELSEEVTNSISPAERRWKVYLSIAADRFETWWKSLTPKNSNGQSLHITMEQCGRLESEFEKAKPFEWTEDNLPPIDVLMILHSFMLNPRCFLEDCIRDNMLPLWKAGMPWNLIERCINSIYVYQPSFQAERLWNEKTGSNSDLRVGDSSLKMNCPRSGCLGYGLREWRNGKVMDAVQAQKRKINTIGVCFTCACQACGAVIDEDGVLVSKLRSAVTTLNNFPSIPLQGTLLSKDGRPISTDKDQFLQNPSNPNNMLKSTLGKNIIDDLDDAGQANDIYSLHEKARKHAAQLPNPNPETNSALTRFLNTTLNSSHFSLCLSSATDRQSVFIESMTSLSWLYSPALSITLQSLLLKYQHFFTILASHPTKIAVPTHAVDLAWHTHQQTPYSYYQYSITRTGGLFIDHDDKLNESTLDNSFTWTTDRFNELVLKDTTTTSSPNPSQSSSSYTECLCWHCTTTQLLQSTSPNTPQNTIDQMVLERIASSQFQKFNDDYQILRIRLKSRKELDFKYNNNDNDNDKKIEGNEETKKKEEEEEINQEEFLRKYKWAYGNAIPIIEIDGGGGGRRRRQGRRTAGTGGKNVMEGKDMTIMKNKKKGKTEKENESNRLPKPKPKTSKSRTKMGGKRVGAGHHDDTIARTTQLGVSSASISASASAATANYS